MSSYRKRRIRWWWQGGVGALLLGSGISCAVESGFLKHQDVPWYVWVLAGTGSFCLIIPGVVLLIKAGILENELQKERDQNK